MGGRFDRSDKSHNVVPFTQVMNKQKKEQQKEVSATYRNWMSRPAKDKSEVLQLSRAESEVISQRLTIYS